MPCVSISGPRIVIFWPAVRGSCEEQPSPLRRSRAGKTGDPGPTLDLDRYVPAFITFIANKLSNSATAFYQKNFGVNVTDWRIMSLLAIEPGIPASRICHVIGFNKGPVSRTLSVLQKRGLVTIRTAPDDGRTPFDLADRQGARDP